LDKEKSSPTGDPGMNTGQLVVLWYAGLMISGIMFVNAFMSENFWYVIGGIAVLAGVLIYTLKDHPKANKGLLFLWVVGPFILLAFYYLRQNPIT
jgi:1,4-dihydroxy-2-naphthoate octaprenyltransferase